MTNNNNFQFFIKINFLKMKKAIVDVKSKKMWKQVVPISADVQQIQIILKI